jgi:uncharacterized protein HemX/uroporphyrinogen-III synthase
VPCDSKKLRVLVTRPKPLGKELCAAIFAAGDQAIYFPTIEIVPPDDTLSMEENIEMLDQLDWLIFISPQSVLQSAEKIQARWPHFPANVRIAAIGPGTAKTLEKWNFTPLLVPEKNWDSEGLLALPEFQHIHHKKIALVRGEGGREKLAEQLTARGALVSHIVAYQRALPEANPEQIQLKDLDVIICTSNEGLHNLVKLINQPGLTETPVLVISERMVKEARELGFKTIFLAKDASHHAILDALEKVKGSIMTNKMETTPESNESSKSSYDWIWFVLLAIAIAAASYFAYFYMNAANKTVVSSVSSVQKNLTDVQQSIESMQQQLQHANDEIKSQSQAIATLQQMQGNSKNMWAILEAQYLVKLANDNLQFENNTALAISLLQAADHSLQGLNDSKAAAIRQALATDITALQAVSQVDTVGMYAKLSALNQEVDTLPLPTKIIAPTEVMQATDEKLPWWKRGLEETMHALGKIVVVRYNPSGSLPLVTPEQQDFLYQNMHAILEKAMWAVLHKQPEIYKASVQQAIDWVKKYFLQDSPVTQSMLKNLNELLQVDVRPAAPAISGSVDAFNAHS